MAREPRLNFEGALYHVFTRGNNGQKVFLSPRDYDDFLNFLAKYRQLYDVVVYAYCLMPTHPHLLLETRKANLSRFMQRLLSSYSLKFNLRHKKRGHVLQGRFKSILVEKDAYLLELVRYIHLNPVKAGLTKDPLNWTWSSLRTYAGTGKIGFVETKTVMGYFPKRRAFLDFVYDGIGKEFRYDPVGGIILGTDAFVQNMKKRLRPKERNENVAAASNRRLKMAEIAETVASAFGVNFPAAGLLRSRRASLARNAVAFALRNYTSATLSEIAEVTGATSPQSALKSIRSFEVAMKKSKAIAAKFASALEF